MTIRTLVGMLAVATLLAACGLGDGDPSISSSPTPSPPSPSPSPSVSPSPSPSPSPPAVGAGAVAYLLLDDGQYGGPHLVPVWAAGATGDLDGVLGSLLDGPAVADPASPAMSTGIPEGTEVLSAELDGSTARIDLSDAFDDGGGSTAMFARLTQLVYTATGLDGVDAVELLIEGEPVEVFSSEGIVLEQPLERSDYLDTGIVPKLFVDRPAWGEPVSPAFTASGMARDLFEATFVYEVGDGEDETLVRGPVTADGSQGWNAFSVEIETGVTEPRRLFLTVLEDSAEDGSTIYLRQTPIRIVP